jgi:hypothetical protein
MRICRHCSHVRCKACKQVSVLIRREKDAQTKTGRAVIRRELTGDKKDYFVCCACWRKAPIRRIKWQPTLRLL